MSKLVCGFVSDGKGRKCFIPRCMGGAVYGSRKGCTCETIDEEIVRLKGTISSLERTQESLLNKLNGKELPLIKFAEKGK